MKSQDHDIASTLESLLEELQDLIRDEVVPGFLSAKLEDGAVRVPGWGGDPRSSRYLAQVVRSGAALEQYGLSEGEARRLAARAVDYLFANLWDSDHAGWLESPDAPDLKQTHTQAQLLAALAQFLMISGDFEVAEKCVETFKNIQTFAANNQIGGYGTSFSRDWRVVEAGESPEASAALAEAFALLYQAIGVEIYRRRSLEAVHRLLLEASGKVLPQLLRSLELLDPEEPIAANSTQDSDSLAGLIEFWQYTRQIIWLERFIAAKRSDFPSLLIKEGSWSIPDLLRLETLLLRALYRR